MRVLHVAECVGGVDRYLRSLLKYSTCENIVVLSQLYDLQAYKSLATYSESMHMSHDVGLSALKETFILRKKIKKYRPDIVYAHSSIAGAITRMACIGLKVKVVYNPHGWAFNMESNKRKVFILLEKLMAHFCDAIICISDAEKESALREKICTERKLHVIYNGIDIDGYETEEMELPIPKDAFVVGMVGRICKQKAPDVFVKMAGEVQKKVKNAYFVIVGDVLEGDVDEKKKVENLAKELGIRLWITGWVNNPLEYMSRFDVGCLFSRWEGFGLVIPEYMLTRIPIVATRVDAIPYLIQDGINGMLVDKDDWKAAAEKVILLLLDEHIRKKIVSNEEQALKARFDVRRLAKELDDLYKVL